MPLLVGPFCIILGLLNCTTPTTPLCTPASNIALDLAGTELPLGFCFLGRYPQYGQDLVGGKGRMLASETRQLKWDKYQE
jgi:hypothetical protein